MKALVFSPTARRDLAEIAEYILKVAGAPMAAEVVMRIRGTCRLIADTPGEVGTLRPEIGEGIRSFPVRPYVLFFRYEKDEIHVARIHHERRDVERIPE